MNTKYLFDFKNCLEGSNVLYNKSDLDIYILLSHKTSLKIPKGRTQTKLLPGADIFLKAKTKTVKNVHIPGPNSIEQEFSWFLKKDEKAKEFVVVTQSEKFISICKEKNIDYISLEKLAKKVSFDKEAYDNVILKISKETKSINKSTKIASIILYTLIFLSLVFSNYSNEILSFLSITYIIPIAIILSSLLFKVKKNYLLLYTITQFIMGLLIVYLIFNFYKDEQMDFVFKLLALMSAVLICVRSFENFDIYASKNTNKITDLWNKAYREQRV